MERKKILHTIQKKLKNSPQNRLFTSERIKAILLLCSITALILILSAKCKTTLLETKKPVLSVTGNSMAIQTAYIAPKVQYYLTRYCSCEECTGYRHEGEVIGAEGTILVANVSVAANLPFGTMLLATHADGTQSVYVVQDRGNLGNNHIDLYVENHATALSTPNEYVEIQIIGDTQCG